jgi:hypothetical protein
LILKEAMVQPVEGKRHAYWYVSNSLLCTNIKKIPTIYATSIVVQFKKSCSLSSTFIGRRNF